MYLFSICRLRISNRVNELNKRVKRKVEPIEDRQTVFSKSKGRPSAYGSKLNRPIVADYPYPNSIPMRFESIWLDNIITIFFI